MRLIATQRLEISSWTPLSCPIHWINTHLKGSQVPFRGLHVGTDLNKFLSFFFHEPLLGAMLCTRYRCTCKLVNSFTHSTCNHWHLLFAQPYSGAATPGPDTQGLRGSRKDQGPSLGFCMHQLIRLDPFFLPKETEGQHFLLISPSLEATHIKCQASKDSLW